MSKPQVIFYSQPGCPSCVTAKEYLSSRQVEFEEKNIRSDAGALRELVEELGSRSTPTLVVEDQVLIGFDPAEYDAALRKISK